MSESQKKKQKGAFREYAEALAIALLLAFVIRSFVVQAFKIPSGSMLPTLKIGDHLLVNKFLYGLRIPFTDVFITDFSDPEFQDIVVFRFPENESKDFIKRVIGTPGDTIRIRDQQVYRNGKRLKEPYIRPNRSNVVGTFPKNKWPPHSFDPRVRNNLGPIEVPENKYFVMGDNRGESYDSRFWGFVEENKILGEAWIIYWSWKSWTDIRWSRIGDVVD
ncbi:MAG: signal peptidase I [Desulfohalobiaceae bacterium]|nr:signal peptidase I [Desulfohalobiaceae bacterium]